MQIWDYHELALWKNGYTAFTMEGSTVGCECMGDEFYLLTAKIHFTANLYVDKNPATLAHEMGHAQLGFNRIVELLDMLAPPAEQMPYSSKEECEAAGALLLKTVASEFNSKLSLYFWKQVWHDIKSGQIIY